MNLVGGLRALRRRTFFVPETLQTSMMDCGPSALKSIFDGHRRPINLERLRERCQTDVDGTSLGAMRDVADRLGLEVDTIMVPKDSLLLKEAACLPAIIVLKNPNGLLHFVVAWSTFGSWVQVMDPSSGRKWIRAARLLEDVAVHPMKLPESQWREWAGGEDFQNPLLTKMRAVGVSSAEAKRLTDVACADPSPRSLAALDAATRFVGSLVDADALPRGAPARDLLLRAFESDRAAGSTPTIPQPFWICRPSTVADEVISTGAVLLTIMGLKDEDDGEEEAAGEAAPGGTRVTMAGTVGLPRTRQTIGATRLSMVGLLPTGRTLAKRATKFGATGMARMSVWAGPVLPKPVMNELRADTVRPLRIFARLMWEDSRAAVMLVAAVVLIGAGTGVLDALMMRGLSDLLGHMNLVAHRMVAVAAVVGFLILALVFEMSQAHLVQRLARGLETRLRVAFLEKLPKLEDRYFRSRPTSDLAARAHLLATLRGVPRLAVDGAAGLLRLLTVAGVLVWLEPRLWKLAVALVVVCLTIPVVSYRVLDEAMARVRVLGANLYRFYLDALLGAVPIRVHGGERSVRREHEAILTEWVRSALRVESRSVAMRGAERLLGTLIAITIVVMFVRSGGDIRALLLIAFFAQKLPGEAEALVGVMRRYPLMKHDALRLFEPLAAAENDLVAPTRVHTGVAPGGVEIIFKGVTAVAGGQAVLDGIDLSVAPGEHIAVVGPSGAGKSSLVGLLLGWLYVSDGKVLVDRRPLDAQRIVQLREETAWVDPAVQLWNQTLLENMLYGHGDDVLADIEEALTAADLLDVVERMPDGLQSPLGEGGARVSGGQGQRVRVARALLKRDARLVVLDEPFRGLERPKRRALLRRARERWPSATLFFVSHDVGDTLDMDRVIVVKDGTVVEDGAPRDLLRNDGTYSALVQGDRDALTDVWGRPEWRRLRIDDGRLVAEVAAEESEA